MAPEAAHDIKYLNDVLIMTHVVVKNVFRKESIGFTGLITIALVAAKAMGFLDIEWLWVFAPLWWPAAFVLGLMLIFVTLIIIVLFLAIIAVNAVKIAYHLT
ncbi:hypothetical protein [Methanomethylovorans sp.]|uniref:hypothetical protein n=1 Tax=Methanomethylovorans sp. TaxID=2758717 RepID=UPI002FDDB6F1